MTPHGPDASTFSKGVNEELKPVKFNAGLAFMFESSLMMSISNAALSTPADSKVQVSPRLQTEYYKVWQGFQKAKVE